MARCYPQVAPLKPRTAERGPQRERIKNPTPASLCWCVGYATALGLFRGALSRGSVVGQVARNGNRWCQVAGPWHAHGRGRLNKSGFPTNPTACADLSEPCSSWGTGQQKFNTHARTVLCQHRVNATRHLTDFPISDGGRLTWHHDLSRPRADSQKRGGDAFLMGAEWTLKEVRRIQGEETRGRAVKITPDPPHFRLEDPWFLSTDG